MLIVLRRIHSMILSLLVSFLKIRRIGDEELKEEHKRSISWILKPESEAKVKVR